MDRRSLFPWLAVAPLLASNLAGGQETRKSPKLKIMMKSAWGSDDPTRASFPFVHGLALADAGHDVQIFLVGEGTYTMRKATVDAIFPVGWPPLHENHGESCRQENPYIRLRSLFPGPWGHGSRLKPVGREVRKPRDFCVACRVG